MKKQYMLAALLAAAPFAASAQALSYTFVEGGYDQVDVDGLDGVDIDGGYGRGSVSITDNLNLFGQYTKGSGEEVWASNSGGHHIKYDIELGELGLGYRHPMSDRLDLIAEVAAVNVALKITREERPFFGNTTPYSVVDLDESSTAARVAVGVRSSITDQLEGWAKAGYIGDAVFDGGMIGTAGIQFKFARVWGVVGEVESSGDWSMFRVGVRASF